jgi:hypothetical protein
VSPPSLMRTSSIAWGSLQKQRTEPLDDRALGF